MENKKFDLSERTSLFAKNLIAFLRKIKQTNLNKTILLQLIKSGTSIGANYHEADSAESRKDFIHKIGICKKEARESMYWLDLLKHSNPEIINSSEVLEKEAKELFLILNSIIKKTRDSLNQKLDISN